jgi:hypothetical protein
MFELLQQVSPATSMQDIFWNVAPANRAAIAEDSWPRHAEPGLTPVAAIWELAGWHASLCAPCGRIHAKRWDFSMKS